MRAIGSIIAADEPESEEKKTPQKPEEMMSERFLKTRTILLTGEVDKDLSEKVIRHLLLLESISSEPIHYPHRFPRGRRVRRFFHF